MISNSSYTRLPFYLVCPYFRTEAGGTNRGNLDYIRTMKEFKANLFGRFAGANWLEAIDFSKFAIVAGSVLNALCKIPFDDTQDQDVNLIYYGKEMLDFELAVQNLILNLKQMKTGLLTNRISVEKIPGVSSSITILVPGARLNISFESSNNSENSLSHILHNMDMDISQVAFIGEYLFNKNRPWKIL